MIGDLLGSLPIPAPGDRVTAMGNSGEGKSHLMRELVRAMPNVIIINTKHSRMFDDPSIAVPIRDDRDIMNTGSGRFNFFPSDDWMRTMEKKEQFFQWLFHHAKSNFGCGGFVAFMDEINDICPSAQVYPYYLQKCVKQGREWELGIWCGTQEPVRAPAFAFGQSQHRYLWFLGWEPHRKAAEGWYEQKIPWDLMPERSHKFLLKTPKGVYGPMKLEQPN